MSYSTRAAAVLLALIATLALTACGSDSDPTTTTTATGATGATTTGGSDSKEDEAKPPAPTIYVLDGEPMGGVQELEYSSGDEVRFTVHSDVAEEVHVHGYDLAKDVAAGGSVSFSFLADLEGIFEVELEASATQIAELTVNP